MIRKIVALSLLVALAVFLVTYTQSTSGPTVAEVQRFGIQRMIVAERMVCLQGISESKNMKACYFDDGGTKRSAQFSPEGKLIAFKQGRRIYEFREREAGDGFDVWRYRPGNKGDEEMVDFCIATQVSDSKLNYECKKDKTETRRVRYLEYTPADGRLAITYRERVTEYYFDRDARLVAHHRVRDDDPEQDIVEGRFREISYHQDRIVAKKYRRRFNGDWFSRQYLWLTTEFEWGDDWEEAKKVFEPEDTREILIAQRDDNGLPTEYRADEGKEVIKLRYEYYE